MDSENHKKLLLIGATSYIGGAILATLTESPISVGLSITVLVEKPQQAEILERREGIRAVLFRGSSDVEVLTMSAADHDIVIHAPSSPNKQTALDLIAGLAGRKKRTGKEVIFIHSSSTVNIAEAAVGETDMIPYSDNSYIPSLLRRLNYIREYSPRTTDLAVLTFAAPLDVKAFIVMAPEVYGTSAGLFEKISLHIADFALDTLQHGYPGVVEEGFGEVSHVHVQDLASFYTLLVTKLAFRKKEFIAPGVLFCSSGTHLWRNVAHFVGRIGLKERVLLGSLPVELTEEEAAGRWTGGDLWELRRRYCACFETKADKARTLGWRPERGEEDWNRWVYDSAKAVFED